MEANINSTPIFPPQIFKLAMRRLFSYSFTEFQGWLTPVFHPFRLEYLLRCHSLELGAPSLRVQRRQCASRVFVNVFSGAA
jgi:hypothetical protein